MSRKPKVMSSAVRFNILTAIQHDDRLSTTARVVASILLLRYWNRRHRGRCNPAMETLAEDVGCARRSVCRAVEELKKLGWLSIIGTRGGHRQTNQYNFQMAKNIQNVSRKLNRYITSEEEINQQEQYDTPIVENSTVPNPVHTVLTKCLSEKLLNRMNRL
jgi:hypothetical protein